MMFPYWQSQHTCNRGIHFGFQVTYPEHEVGSVFNSRYVTGQSVSIVKTLVSQSHSWSLQLHIRNATLLLAYLTIYSGSFGLL